MFRSGERAGTAMRRMTKVWPAALALLLLTAVFCGCGKKKEVLLPPAAEDTPAAGTLEDASEGTAATKEDLKESAGSGEGTEEAAGEGAAQAEAGAAGEEGVLQEGQTEIKLYLNGNRLVPDAVPYESDGTAFVPIAEICSYFSRSISCSQEGETLTIQDADKGNEIVIEAGRDKAIVNGAEVKLAAPAVLSSGGTMMVELSSFRSLLDADNKYQEDIGAAYITESGLC